MDGIIDVGGGLRDIYGAGVFDRLMDDGITFEYCIGVSAGSANVASYIAGQKGRNYKFYTEYPLHKEYMSLKNLIRKRAYLDLDYVYGVLSNTGGLNPLDYEKFSEYAGEFRVVATDAYTGKAKYFDRHNISKDNYDILKASSCLPVVCPPYRIGEGEYYDGGLSDPVPLDKAFEDGCDRVVLILTKPIVPMLINRIDLAGARVLERKFPKFAEAMRAHNDRYNKAVEAALKLQAEGKVLIICPDDICGMGTLTKDKAKLDMLYNKGYADGGRIKKFLSARAAG